MSEVILTQNKIHGRIPEWPKGTDCKSAANCFDGSNPSPSICRSGGTGRRPGLKIPWVVIPVPVRSRFAARLRALIHTNRSSFSISIFQPPVPTTSLAAARSVLRDAQGSTQDRAGGGEASITPHIYAVPLPITAANPSPVCPPVLRSPSPPKKIPPHPSQTPASASPPNSG